MAKIIPVAQISGFIKIKFYFLEYGKRDLKSTLDNLSKSLNICK